MSKPKRYSVTDGVRTIGHVVEHADRLEAFSWPEEVLVGTYGPRELREAMRAVAAADVKRREIAGATA